MSARNEHACDAVSNGAKEAVKLGHLVSGEHREPRERTALGAVEGRRDAPDTATASLEFPKDFSTTYVGSFNNRTDDGGLEFRGSEATMKIDRQRLAVYPRDGQNVPGTHAPEPSIYVRSTADGGIAHLQNWIDCMRSRKTPAADIRVGHVAARTSHLANIALREERRVTAGRPG